MMVRSQVRALLPLMLLASCGGGGAVEDGANAQDNAAAIPPGPMLGATDLSKPLRLEGDDWALDLAPGRILYRPAGKEPIPFYPVSPRLSGGQAVYPSQTPEGERVTITLRTERCGTGDAATALAATVAIGTRSYAGCASPLPIEQIRYDMYNEAMSGADNAGG